jgi:hypothetical protein
MEIAKNYEEKVLFVPKPIGESGDRESVGESDQILRFL